MYKTNFMLCIYVKINKLKMPGKCSFNWLLIACYILGQVLTRDNIENIIKFAKQENLFILADEVNHNF